MYETKLSTKGQLVLPAKVREQKKTRSGTPRFRVFPTPYCYDLIEIPKDPLKALRGMAKGLWGKIIRYKENVPGGR